MLTGSRLSLKMVNKVLVGDRHLTIARSLSSKWIKYSICPNYDWLRRDLFKRISRRHTSIFLALEYMAPLLDS